jgi:hypothetical protein
MPFAGTLESHDRRTVAANATPDDRGDDTHGRLRRPHRRCRRHVILVRVMPLAQDEITTISLDVIRQHAAHLELVGLMASEGGSDRVEIMVTVKGCHAEPCRLLLNLSRADKETLEAELRSALREALVTHARSTDSFRGAGKP